MGYSNQAQQAVQDIIVQTPDVKVVIESDPVNYWWLLLLAIIPAVIPFIIKRKKK